MSKLRVVHYINQFFANIGGEEKADYKPELREGNVGPGLAFQQSFGEEAEIVATVICGDSYFNENVDSATATVLDMIKSQNPDLVICGPAFNAGGGAGDSQPGVLQGKEEKRSQSLFSGGTGLHPGTPRPEKHYICRGAYGRENAPYAPLLCPADGGQTAQRQGNRRQQEKADAVAGQVLGAYGEEIPRSGARRECQ